MKTFCCCLPTRLGVLLLSPLTLCFAAACSTISLYALFRYLDDLALSQRICLAVIGFSTAFLALTSLFGFIGAIVAKRQCVSVYNLSLWIVIFVVTSFGMINFAVQWHLQERFIHACKQDNQNRSNKQCRAIFFTAYGMTLTFWLAATVLAIYLANVVRHYVRQLNEEYYGVTIEMDQHRRPVHPIQNA